MAFGVGLADQRDVAVASLLRTFYAGRGLWRDCAVESCAAHNADWGSDSLTYVLFMRWDIARDAHVLPPLAALAESERTYGPPCTARAECLQWSDVPLWDSVAAAREYSALTADSPALSKAVAAFWAVEGSPVYGGGACPSIRYQRPFGRGDFLKTLETDSNGIKAALLLYEATRERRYLTIARIRYHAVRLAFFEGSTSLYSTYVFDDGKTCRRLPRRYFASVNGNMIWNGLVLARLTGLRSYRAQAFATADSVVRRLSDGNGIFADLQAENDIVEPLVEAMLAVATWEHQSFARRWILENAAAAQSARRSDGVYGRFFDGPPPDALVTAWQANGGFALQIAAASLAPRIGVQPNAWSGAKFVARETSSLPSTIRFTGRGIALLGTVGDRCCQAGHARVFLDGVETVNAIGIWQNKSSSGRRLPHSVLFAWRWRTAGKHELRLLPGTYDAKEGGSYLHLDGYEVLR